MKVHWCHLLICIIQEKGLDEFMSERTKSAWLIHSAVRAAGEPVQANDVVI